MDFVILNRSHFTTTTPRLNQQENWPFKDLTCTSLSTRIWCLEVAELKRTIQQHWPQVRHHDQSSTVDMSWRMEWYGLG
ncbi:hypothetical protein TNCV_2886571 [Trichonephila clavipes]|nr:hypothetical protein TNCV_2886571 [Trichonephila clavipes]